MSNDQPFSEEYLNSFVDNELTTEEKSRAYTTINQDEALNRRVCELRKMHDLVQLAYKNPPQAPSARPAAGHTRTARHGVAAGLVFVLGVLFSWFQFGPSTNAVRQPTQQTAGVPAALSRSTPQDARRVPLAANAAAQEMKVLFHLNSGNPAHIREVLDEAENLLKLYQAQNQPARVEIVTNGQGLNLLLAGRSPYPARVSRMLKQYGNLTFAACQNTMDKFTELGIPTRLLPGAIVIDSGVAQIIRLQQEGWVYIQV